MGTRVELLSLPDDAAAVSGLVQPLFEAWDARFSRFRADSELSRLNAAAGSTFRASAQMIEALRISLDAARLTQGTFDPLLGRRIAELGYDRSFELLSEGARRPPMPEWHAGAWREVQLDVAARTVRLPAGSAFDLGGIAKGMAVDAAIDALRAAGVATAAVNAGGDLAVLGTPPREGAWAIAIEGVAEPVLLERGALATSSVLKRRWEANGELRHHLLDARTGLPADTGILTASVAAASCTAAEVAAKVSLLLGPTEAAQFLASRRLAGLLVLETGAAWRLGEWESAA